MTFLGDHFAHNGNKPPVFTRNLSQKTGLEPTVPLRRPRLLLPLRLSRLPVGKALLVNLLINRAWAIFQIEVFQKLLVLCVRFRAAHGAILSLSR
jgi:hypothetical protein